MVNHFQVSTGKVELLLNEGVRQDTVVTANLHVMNCEHLHINARILGSEASAATQLAIDPFRAEIYGDKLFEPKSFALIYAHNETRSMDRFFKIGQRQPNDTLLMFDEIIIKNEFDSFPQYEIEYNEPNAYITQIEFQFNVSFFIYPFLVSPSRQLTMITAEIYYYTSIVKQHTHSVATNLFCFVLFHFICYAKTHIQSLTATAFLNSSFIQRSCFNAIVYDLNRPQFTVNFNVYGYYGTDKPSQYKSILTF